MSFVDKTSGPRTALRATRTAQAAPEVSGIMPINYDVLTLVHSVYPSGTEWRSTCGFPFLTHETAWHARMVTCLWCVAERVHYKSGY